MRTDAPSDSMFPRGLRALVAESSATIGLVIAGWLRGWGLEVTQVRDSASVTAALSAQSYDVMVADAALAVATPSGTALLAVVAAGQPPPPGAGAWVERPVQAVALRVAVARCLRLRPADAHGIDERAITALWGSVASQGFRRVAEVFLLEAPERIAAMEAARQDDDRGRLAREAHSLAGAAGSVGAGEMAQLSQTLERAAPRGDPARLDDLAATLRRIVARDMAVLQSLIRDRPDV